MIDSYMCISNKHIKIILALFLLLQSVFGLNAQVNALKFNHLTVNDGLPQN